jgi:hypothetical protein
MEELAAKLHAAAKRAGKIVSKERRVLLTFPHHLNDLQTRICMPQYAYVGILVAQMISTSVRRMRGRALREGALIVKRLLASESGCFGGNKSGGEVAGTAEQSAHAEQVADTAPRTQSCLLLL